MKAIIIARVSTEEQREAGNSLPAQVARLEKYCLTKGFEILKIFSFDESAYKDQRNEFDRILDFVIEQKSKVAVCCDKVDRLSRNMFDKRVSILYEKALLDQIELHFVSDSQIINSRISATEKFQFGISLGLAKYYSDAISDNVKRANEQKLRKGEWTGKAPYGYKNITKSDNKKDVIIDEKTSPIIYRAFDLYATGAYSMTLLCKKLNTEYGVSWSKSYIDKVLNNHFYYGIMKIKEKLYPHFYTPIISKALFDQAQQIKAGFNKKNRYKYAGRLYLYRGLLRCADCELAVTPEKHKGHVYYHCTQYNGKHGAKWIREEEITKQLSQIFRRLMMPQEVHQRLVLTLNETHQQKIEFHNRNYDTLNQKKKMLINRIDKLYIDKLDNKISDEAYDKFYKQFRDEIDDIDARLGQLQGANDDYYNTTKYILEICNHGYDMFISSEVDDRRQLIKLILSNLSLDGKKLIFDKGIRTPVFAVKGRCPRPG
jgi:site-specific DNA recombinase